MDPDSNPKPGTRALRKGRYSEPNRIYMVTTVVTRREPIFRDLFLGRRVVYCMQQLTDADFCQSLAWVLMPDHLHWLCQLGDRLTLSQLIRRLKGSSSRQINRMLQRQTSLWQRGFHDHALRKEENIRELARYIIANPIRAGLVDKIGDYPLWDTVWLQ